MPRLEINPSAFVDNYHRLAALPGADGMEIVVVSKVILSNPRVTEPLFQAGASYFADTNMVNLMKCPPGARKMLLKASMSELRQIPHDRRSIDTVYLSSLHAVRILSQVPREFRPEVLVALELGDMREGVALAEIEEFLRKSIDQGVEPRGLAANFACLSGAMPTESLIRRVVKKVRDLREELGIPLPVLSFGGTVIYDLWRGGVLDPEVNQIRVGEAVFFGNDMSSGNPLEGLRRDGFRFFGEVLEVAEKKPLGQSEYGLNAFGRPVPAPVGGLRAVLDFGGLVTEPEVLIPRDSGVEIAGWTHDYLVVDLSRAAKIPRPGDFLEFDVNYSAVAPMVAVPLCEKIFCEDV